MIRYLEDHPLKSISAEKMIDSANKELKKVSSF